MSYDFLYRENGKNLATRNADPFFLLNREWRVDELTPHWERNGDGYRVFVDYGGEEWDCEDGTIVPTSLPKTISKLELLLVLREMGKVDSFVAWLDSAGLRVFWDAAQVIATDHPLFEQAFSSVKTALGITDEQAEEIMERIAK